MQTLREDISTASWLVQHTLTAEDRAAMAAMRAMVEPNKASFKGLQLGFRSTRSWSTSLPRSA